MPKHKRLFSRVDLKNAPKLAEQLGQLSVRWAALEFRLFALFCALSNAPVPIARGIFYAQRTTAARIALIKAVAPMVLRKRRGQGTNAELGRLDKILGRIGNLSGPRAAYIHDPWGSKSEHSPRSFQMRLGGKELLGEYGRVNKQEISRLIERVETQRGALHRFTLRLRPKLPALHEKLEKLRSPDLALAMKGTPRETRKAKRSRQPQSSQA